MEVREFHVGVGVIAEVVVLSVVLFSGDGDLASFISR